MYRTLIYHWRMNLAVIAGAAVASAVLTGALLVGDSVRGSLRALTLERLGGIDQALAGQRFFRQELAADLSAVAPDEGFSRVVPAILLRGSALHARQRTRASNVGLTGIDQGFLELFGAEELSPLLTPERSVFPPAWINRSLADTLGAAEGDDLLISLRRFSDVPSGSLMSRKDTDDVVETLRLRVLRILPDAGLGRFALTVHQASPYNVFVPLGALQKALDQEGRINGVLASASGPDTAGAEGTIRLDEATRRVASAADLGTKIEVRGDTVSVESEEYILRPDLTRTLEAIAAEQNASTLPILTYLVNALRLGEAEVPYSTVSGIGPLTDPALGTLQLADGNPAPPLAEGQILLNTWTAERLGAAVGDPLTLEYFRVGPREELYDTSTEVRVAGIVALEGLGADPTLAQEYPGIAGSSRMADWDPPFPIDLDQIEDDDEAYWDQYRGTPKAFLPAEQARQLWRNRWGDLTSMRLAPAAGRSASELAAILDEELTRRLPLDAFGLGFQPVKELGLGASGGATDFGGLFIGFSFFLIFSAALLVALLFSLGVERRVNEVGLLRAVGFPAAKVRRQLVMEGSLLAAVGSLIGLFGAVLYAEAMMFGLRTWWLPAVGTSRLDLHLKPTTLLIGFLASTAVVIFTVWRRVRRLDEVSTPALLKNVSEPVDTRAGSRAGKLAVAGTGLAVALVVAAVATGQASNPMFFGAAGTALLVGSLALLAHRLGSGGRRGLGSPGLGALLRMAAANGARNRGRSLLSAVLVASASYMIVTVAAFQQDFSHAELGRDSGTGGFGLVAESDVPLQRNLASAAGRFELGLEESALADATIVPMRLLPGDDTSCLNLYQPREPRLLGVPAEMVERGGFQFQATLEDLDNPWELLELDLGPGVIPAIGDFNSTQWILKLGLGEELEMKDEAGRPLRLRLVGTLKTSLFQSELLVSEQQLKRYFPSLSGWSYFLVETGADSEALSQSLESGLEDYGFDALPAAQKLESFHAVQNTYLSTFRTLGGLGLLLGTVGLAIILLRNVIERRSELAALRAFGFRRGSLSFMVVAENALLLLAGLVIGTAAALLTAAPNLVTYAEAVPWAGIASTLGAIYAFGLVASTLAALSALRAPLIPALKSDR